MPLIVAVLGSLEITQWLLLEWDALAVAARRPLSAPDWVLAWSSHVAPAAGLLLVAARDEGGLQGLLPLVRSKGRLLPAGGDLLTAEPLARPGREAEVASAFATALNDLSGRGALIEFEQEDGAQDWAALLRANWPGTREPHLRVGQMTPIPRLRLGGLDFDAWLASKSSNFRRDFTRKARRLEREGAVLRRSDASTLDEDLAAFMRLHEARHPRGSSLAAPGVMEMLREVGRAQIDSGRFRLICLDRDGSTDAALVLGAAGGEVSAWASGHDERLARHSPMMQCFVHAVREMTERGEQRLNLGPGGQAYKQRLASEQGSLATTTLIPRGVGSAWARSRDALRRARGGGERGLRRCGRAVKQLGARPSRG